MQLLNGHPNVVSQMDCKYIALLLPLSISPTLYHTTPSNQLTTIDFGCTQLRLIDFHEDAHELQLVQELAAGGDLFDAIAQEGKLPLSKAHHFFTQLIVGLRHCHAHGVVHRDLKPVCSSLLNLDT